MLYHTKSRTVSPALHKRNHLLYQRKITLHKIHCHQERNEKKSGVSLISRSFEEPLMETIRLFFFCFVPRIIPQARRDLRPYLDSTSANASFSVTFLRRLNILTRIFTRVFQSTVKRTRDFPPRKDGIHELPCLGYLETSLPLPQRPVRTDCGLFNRSYGDVITKCSQFES